MNRVRNAGFLQSALRSENVCATGSTDASNNNIETTIAGASYRIHADNYLVAAYETTKDHTKTDADKKGQIVLQISF